MTKLEQNNLDTQIMLMNDIIQNYRGIIYHITENGKELMKIVRSGKTIQTENVDEVIFTKEQNKTLFDIAYNLSEESRFETLGILATKAVPDNLIKTKILIELQK